MLRGNLNYRNLYRLLDGTWRRNFLSEASQKPQPTFLTGLSKDPRAIETLRSLYQETLTAIQNGLPSTAFYRQTLEKTLNERLGLLSLSPTPSHQNAEQALGEGILEEVIEQAKAELQLIRKISSQGDWPIWEPLEHPPPLN